MIYWVDGQGELLSLLISDVKEVLSHIDVNKEDIDTQLEDAANVLAKIVTQDIEQDKKNKPRIKKGLPKTALSPLLILKMRHARKSSSSKFNGYQELQQQVCLIMLLRGEIIRNVFLKIRMILGNI